MYKILFHIAGIAIIEILFYFYYIGPIETQLFKNSVKDAVNPNDDIVKNDPIHIISPYNTSQYFIIEDSYESNVTQYLKDSSKNAEKKRNKENSNLFDNVLILWIISVVICSFIMTIWLSVEYFIFINKRKKLKKSKSSEDSIFEMSSLKHINRNREDSFDQTDIIQNEPTEEKFFNFDKIKKKFLRKGLEYFLLSLGILVFEYLFFNFVILNYNVISNEELEYLFYTILNPLAHKYISYNIQIENQ